MAFGTTSVNIHFSLFQVIAENCFERFSYDEKVLCSCYTLQNAVSEVKIC